ncbi:hypothetical protein [Deinococcus marmoris]|uniref:Uncharacterized protein n=1 Tax=Deinococcus marmoris TaxID=249408 RepID=A0A1U7P541_9DEIO|nr:hypothetical protein [Deinococcus marmoris]OLV20270.1 hypothetical protein BOO71_0000274 [Deinococcus marmoris]
MMYFTDVERTRARLVDSAIPAKDGMAYLQVLSNLNALSLLLAPLNADELEDGETERLEKMFRDHLARRTLFEVQYPELVVLSRPDDWTGN